MAKYVGFVYFIVQHHEVKRSLTKIGWARDPLARLKALQTANPYQLYLPAYFTGTQLSERRIHKGLDFCRVRGEWFELGVNAIDLVEEYFQARMHLTQATGVLIPAVKRARARSFISGGR